MASHLAETRGAFDGVAEGYDRSNAANLVLQEMRRRTIAAVLAHVPAGSRLLDLGCGPGADAARFAAAGYRVLAMDSSPEMVGQARRRVRREGLQERVEVLQLGIHELDRLETVAVDGAYSDFGPLNCVPDLGAVAAALVRRLRPGGVFVASVIGRVCPWELALYASRGDWRRLHVRFTSGFAAVPLNGRRVWTRYYTPREFVAAFRAVGFRPAVVRALGLLAPPPYLHAFAERHPHLIRRLFAIEDRLAGWPGLRQAGDHFLAVLKAPDPCQRS